MRVFVTGASGWVGSAVSRLLVGAGHEVKGLARSDQSAARIENFGGTVVRGELGDLDVLAASAQAADAVIHCAFIHDFTNYEASVVADKRAIEAMGEALAGTGRPLLVTSGTAALAEGRTGTEDDPFDTRAVPRLSEAAALPFADRGVRISVIRLPFSVHGDRDHGFISRLIQIAHDKDASAYVDAGDNHWPAVHVEDAARLFVLALEKGRAGARYHAVGDTGVRFRDIAAAVGRRLGVPTISVPSAEAAAHFGWMGNFAGLDRVASSELTKARLGWQATRPGLIEDLEHGLYFEAYQPVAGAA